MEHYFQNRAIEHWVGPNMKRMAQKKYAYDLSSSTIGLMS
jgi:hypothetical protein